MDIEENFTDRRRNDPWHLDKRVPISLIIFLLIQTMVAATWVSKQDFVNTDQYRRIEKLEVHSSETSAIINSLNERLARLEEKSSAQLDALNRIETALRGHR